MFTNKVAVVTGGESGTGAACAVVLAKAGAKALPKDRMGADIAFAASAVVVDGLIHLYYSLEDKTLGRATVRRYGCR